MSSLEERMNSTALSWRPGETEEDGRDTSNPLYGKFMRMEAATSDFGPYWRMIIEKSDSSGVVTGEEVSVALFHTVLKNELAKLQPRVGDLLGLRYDGKKPRPGQQPIQMYTVRIDRPAAQEFNWGSLNPNEQSIDGKVVYEGAPPPVEPEVAAEPVSAEPSAAVQDEDDIPF